MESLRIARCFLAFLGLTSLLWGCGPDTEALKAEIKAELKAEIQKELEADLEKAVQAQVNRQLASYRVTPGSSNTPVSPEPDTTSTPEPTPSPEPSSPVPEPVSPDPPESAPTAAPVLGQDNALILKRLVAAREVVNNEPKGARSSFSVRDDPVHCFMEFRNKGGPKRVVTVRWTVNGEEVHRHNLDVRADASRHRTNARARLDEGRKGDWTCEVLTESGQRIGSVAFTVR